MSFAAIAMYHAVDTKADPMDVQVSPDRLRQQFVLLRRMGMRGVSVRELLQAGNPGRRVGLTFDDGYADFVTQAMPILAEFGFTASVYPVAGLLGHTNSWDPPPARPLMNEAQVRAAHEAGHEVGSHGMQHVRCSSLSPEELSDQLAGSQRVLEEVIDAPVTGFCYPYGDLSPQVTERARDIYDYALSVSMGGRADRWAIPRFFVGQADHPSRLFAKLALRRVRERRRTP